VKRLGDVWSALRTPLLLLGGLFLLMQSHANAVSAMFARLLSNQSAPLVALSRLVLYVPNTVVVLAYAVLVIALLEAMEIRRLQQPRSDRVKAILALGLAVVPWVFIDIGGSKLRWLPLLMIPTAIFWMFILLNARLKIVEQFVARHRWTARLAEWTFPVSDMLWFTFHRQRLAQAGWIRFLPMTVYLLVLFAAIGAQANVLRKSHRMVKSAIQVYDPHGILRDDQGFWYAETVGYDAGVWRYDATTGSARSYLRASDLHSFALEGGAFYLYDAFGSTVAKIDAASRKAIWEVPVPDACGAVELIVRPGLVVAVGQAGCLITLDARNGAKKAEQRMAFILQHPRALPDGRIAVVSPEQSALMLTNALLTQEETIPLPISRNTRITDTALDAPRSILYVATAWGGILRFDVRQHQWLAPYRIAPGIQAIAVDSHRGLLFAYNTLRGYVEILDLDFGAHRGLILTPRRGNTFVLDPGAQTVTLSAPGPQFTALPKPGGFHHASYTFVTAF